MRIADITDASARFLFNMQQIMKRLVDAINASIRISAIESVERKGKVSFMLKNNVRAIVRTDK